MVLKKYIKYIIIFNFVLVSLFFIKNELKGTNYVVHALKYQEGYSKVQFTYYYPNADAHTGSTTGSGLGVNDFTIDSNGWYNYTYNGKKYVVLAAAVEKCRDSERHCNVDISRHGIATGIHYYNYYDTVQLKNGNTVIDGIILDACGACMWGRQDTRQTNLFDVFVTKDAATNSSVVNPAIYNNAEFTDGSYESNYAYETIMPDSDSIKEELYKKFAFYGFCSNEADCKKKGVLEIYNIIQDVYNRYKKSCSIFIHNDDPCGVEINTGLILETLNYNQIITDLYETYVGELEENEEESKNLFTIIKQFIKKKMALNKVENEIEKVAMAQTEYVKETCDDSTNYFYQVSFNKYVSYLKYGETSTHPNYSGNPVEVESTTCNGPQNDYIIANKNSNSSSSSSDTGEIVENNGNTSNTTRPSAVDSNNYFINPQNRGEEVVNYALQFVGNPYVWGGSSLTNGTDCSGFTMSVYKHFGVSLPHGAYMQRKYGTKIGTGSDLDKAMPGDLLIYSGHVAIYMGNDKRVHAQSRKTGIVVSKNTKKTKIKFIVRPW